LRTVAGGGENKGAGNRTKRVCPSSREGLERRKRESGEFAGLLFHFNHMRDHEGCPWEKVKGAMSFVKPSRFIPSMEKGCSGFGVT